MWSKQETVTYLKLLGVCNQTIRIAIHYGLNQPQSFDNVKDLMANFTYPSMWKSCIQTSRRVWRNLSTLGRCTRTVHSTCEAVTY